MPLHYDLLCLSHLRWDFVFQRPQHLLTRFRRGRVIYVEEPIYEDGARPRMEVSARSERLIVAHPILSQDAHHSVQADLLDKMLADLQIGRYALWYYTPVALPWSRHLQPAVQIYDCMDQLSHFKGADPRLAELEKELFTRVDLVFTGGMSLYEDKKSHHSNVYPFPSSVDVKHFSRARGQLSEPPDQQVIPRPRVGYFGVIDERIDLELLASLARLRPDLHLVMVGPLCKIEAESLPQAPNLHYLGSKDYSVLPTYLAGWDVAMMPFARNDATRYISPTKTPEYLAGGRPVISTSIADVIRPYEPLGLVRIADTAEAFSRAIDEARCEDAQHRRLKADNFLAKISWDVTWARMQELMDTALASRLSPATY